MELFLERVMWESEVWIDGIRADTREGLGTLHVHNLGRLRPGAHRLAVRVNSDMIRNIGDKGHRYGEYIQIIWNGMFGKIELRAARRLRRVKLWPDAASNSVRVTFDPANAPDKIRYRLTDGNGHKVPVRVESVKNGEAIIRLLEKARTWDDSRPRSIPSKSPPDMGTADRRNAGHSVSGRSKARNRRSSLTTATLSCAATSTACTSRSRAGAVPAEPSGIYGFGQVRSCPATGQVLVGK